MSLAGTTAALRAAGCVFAEDEARLLHERAGSPERLAELVAQRIAGVPLEHVLGWVEFCGMEIPLTAGVFVPRARSQLLVTVALEFLRSGNIRRPVVVDLCCGCGAVGVAISAARDVELHAVDLDPVAVRCARGNVGLLGGTVYAGDLDAPLPRHLAGCVDVLVANAPYVPSGDLPLMPAEARDHEPLIALDGGRDGLNILRRVITCAPRWLSPGGIVVVETSEHQAVALLDLARETGLQPRIETDSELEATVLVARKALNAPGMSLRRPGPSPLRRLPAPPG